MSATHHARFNFAQRLASSVIVIIITFAGRAGLIRMSDCYIDTVDLVLDCILCHIALGTS